MQTPSSYPPSSSGGLFHSQPGTNSCSLVFFGLVWFYESAVFGLGFRPLGFQCLAVQPRSAPLTSPYSTSSSGKQGHGLLRISGGTAEILCAQSLAQGPIPGARASFSARPDPCLPSRGALPARSHFPPTAPPASSGSSRPAPPAVFVPVFTTVCHSLLSGQGCGAPPLLLLGASSPPADEAPARS